MNVRQIRDLLVEAVKLDREMHEHVGPRALRGQQIVYQHTFADRAGWGKALNDKQCQLAKEDADPYGPKGQFCREFWEQFNRDPTPQEIARADMVHGWVALIDNPEERRALIGWANSKAGGKSFRRWCFQVEGISQKTGLKRKDRALAKIQAKAGGTIGQHSVSGLNGGLPQGPEIDDVSGTIEAGGDEGEGLNHWRSRDATQSIILPYENDRSGDRRVAVPASAFSWAAKRNEARRQREKKRKAA